MPKPEAYAKALLEIGAVGFTPEKPITFKSGIVSPVYVDNRRFPYHTKQWKLVLKGLAETVKKKKLDIDVIAGMETAGIPHSATLGYILDTPSVFVRKAVKDHGTKKRVEGGSVDGKKVLLVEDHVTTGGSSTSGVEALRAEGAIVNYVLAITNYDFPESVKEFEDAGVELITLVTFQVILKVAQKEGKLTQDEVASIKEWLKDPWGWKGT